MTFGLLVQQLEKFVDNMALEKKLRPGGIQEAALAVIERYAHLKLEDWVHFLRLCQTGEYGTFVHGNVAEVMDKWRVHVDSRLEFAAKQSQGSHEALKEEERKVIDEKIHKGYNQLIMEAAYRKEAEGEYNKYLKTMRALGVPAREAREQKKLQHFITKIAEADKWERGKQRWERLREHREKVQKFTEKQAV